MKRDRRLGLWLSLCGLSMLMSGCVSRLAKYDVEVKADDSLADARGMYPSIELHLLALNALDSQRMDQQSMSAYWDPNRRPDVLDRCVMHFGGQQANRQILRNQDPIWERWNRAKALNLFVLADLPGIVQDRPSIEDPRRVVIPLQRTRRWWRPHWIVQVRINRGDLSYVPPQEYRKD
jgi:hypothetical protein